MTIRRPPETPNFESLPPEVGRYLQEVNFYLVELYNRNKNLDFAEIVKVTSSDAVPTGGQDGDIHFRAAGANTGLYHNINGSWSKYNNP